MTDKQIRSIVSRAIAATKPVAWKYYHLCWWEQRVECHHVRHTKDRHEVFFSAVGNVFLNNLSAVQWRLATERIANFCRRRGIVLEVPSGTRREDSARPTRRRQLTESDARRLHALLTREQDAESDEHSRVYAAGLERLLEAADVVAPRDVPEDVVTMNSLVRLRNEDDDIEATLFLVFPADARGSDVERPKLSIFTNTGLSMLGRRVGDAIDGHLRILDLPYQPEAAGDYEL